MFVGQLPFDVEEETLWKHFAVVGQVDAVRLVRDPITNKGKGIGFVAFKVRPFLLSFVFAVCSVFCSVAESVVSLCLYSSSMLPRPLS